MLIVKCFWTISSWETYWATSNRDSSTAVLTVKIKYFQETVWAWSWISAYIQTGNCWCSVLQTRNMGPILPQMSWPRVSSLQLRRRSRQQTFVKSSRHAAFENRQRGDSVIENLFQSLPSDTQEPPDAFVLTSFTMIKANTVSGL